MIRPYNGICKPFYQPIDEIQENRGNPLVFVVFFFVCVCGSNGKEFACNAGDPGSIPGSGRSPGEGNDYPVQYSCLENRMDRGAWWATIHKVAKSRTQLSD